MFDRPRSKRDHVDREGSRVPQNGGNGPPTVETGVLLIGRGVAYRKTEETYLCWSATVETGVLFIGRGVAYRKTGLHGILFISTVDLLQPPRAPVHPASTTRYSTGYYSITPPRAPLHRLLFIQPSTTPRGPVHPEATPPLTVHPTTPPRNAHCSSQRQHRSASVSSSSEGIARSGSVNNHRSIARVQ